MAETRTNRRFSENPTASGSGIASRRIPAYESDALTSRIKEVIGDKKVVWFAAECGIGESTLRNILQGAIPRTDILVAIADAGGVALEWLAAGRGPKERVKRIVADVVGDPLPGEPSVIAAYRACNEAGKAAIECVAEAVLNETPEAWLDAGMAIRDAARQSAKK